jgi:hypothetical protein
MRLPEAPQLAHADALENGRHGRQWAIQHLGDLGAGEPQPPQRGDDLDGLLVGAIGHPLGRRRAIDQTGHTLGAIARHPLRAGPAAHLGRLGGLRDRPALLDDPQHHPLALSE